MFSSTREYEACVLVNGKPVTEVTHNGRTYIEGRNNSVYKLRFTNKTSRRVLIIPSVDGLNVLDGKPCGKDSRGYVVGAYGSITIPGWTVDGSTAAKFMFKPQNADRSKDETYVEAMGENPENQGVIGFMVFTEAYPVNPRIWRKSTFLPKNRWDDGTDDASDCMIRSSVSSAAFSTNAMGVSSNVTTTMNSSDAMPNPDEGKSLGTGFGKATDFETTTTSFSKASSNPQVVFSFFYDTLQNLKKIGVPVKHFQKKGRKKKGPNPFPMSPELMGLCCQPPRGWRR